MPRTAQHRHTSSFAEHHRKPLVRDNDSIMQGNPNSNWVNYKGAWLTTIIIIVLARALFGVVPGISSELAWTLTNLSFNTVTFFMFHWMIGTPFDFNQGACDGMTLWEQIDNEVQFTPAKKFYTALPIVLFLVSTHYTHYDASTFLLNVLVLMIVLIGKLPEMHRVRILGINSQQQ
ncbi:ORMDL family-domain-containing protein [Blastocladiella britannica]|nr:ORMDL family-domain-containing protein [Blastocladiella britannica]